MLATIFTSLIAFVATNIDDLFILMLFYGSRQIKSSHIMLGQYAGIGTLVGISFLGAFIGNFVDQRFIGLLGLFPIYLSIHQIIGLTKNKDEADETDIDATTKGVFAIAGVTIANGGDNLGVYIPLLTTMHSLEKMQLLIVFLIMTYVWCAGAKFLASRPLVARQLDRYGHILMPIVLFFLGVFILVESGTPSLIGLLFKTV